MERFHEKARAGKWILHLHGGVGEQKGVVQGAVERLKCAQAFYCYEWVGEFDILSIKLTVPKSLAR